MYDGVCGLRLPPTVFRRTIYHYLLPFLHSYVVDTTLRVFCVVTSEGLVSRGRPHRRGHLSLL